MVITTVPSCRLPGFLAPIASWYFGVHIFLSSLFESVLFGFSGIVLICLALCVDAVIGNVQEKAMKAYAAPNTEVVSNNLHIVWLYS